MSDKPMPAWAVFAVLGATLATPFCSGSGGGRPDIAHHRDSQIERELPPPSAFELSPPRVAN